MTTKLKIEGHEGWWSNFVASVGHPIYEPYKFMVTRDDILKNEYQAYIESVPGPHNLLVFEEEQTAILFVLKWS